MLCIAFGGLAKAFELLGKSLGGLLSSASIHGYICIALRLCNSTPLSFDVKIGRGRCKALFNGLHSQYQFLHVPKLVSDVCGTGCLAIGDLISAHVHSAEHGLAVMTCHPNHYLVPTITTHPSFFLISELVPKQIMLNVSRSW